MSAYTRPRYAVRLSNPDRRIGDVVNVAVYDRIFCADGHPLGDALVSECECEIVEIGAYWSDQPHGRSGRWYAVSPIEPLPRPSRADRAIVLGGAV